MMFFNHKNSQTLIHSALRKNSPNLESTVYNDTKNDDTDDNDDDEEVSHSSILGHHNNLNDMVKVKEQNAVKLVLENEAYCFDMKLFAEKLVEAILIEASKTLIQDEETVTLADIQCVSSDEIIDYNDQRESSEKHSSDVKFSDTTTENSTLYWPKISEFNIKLGLEKIENYVKEWERSDAWEFCVEFLGFECEDCSNIFVFEVEWSKPTMSYPIPQTTASVYFAMEVYKMVPHNYDRCIEVTYVFECSTVIHHPGRINFQEKWLEDIIDAKLKFFKTITFSVPKGHCDTSSPKIPHILK